MNFYKELELILCSQNPKEKIARFENFYLWYKCAHVNFERDHKAKEFEEPSYSQICKIVPPQSVPKRNNLTTKEGQINLLHAIVHIEYSAIDLALDAAYRFADLPRVYYDDWLEVADDEIRHFLMLEALMQELETSYGAIEVHNALFESSQRTLTLVERMAVVPRYLEANGLDATPMLLEKLQKLPQNIMIEKIIKTLEIILDEEIEHVRKGDVWFAYACKQENISTDVYFKIIKKYYPQGFLRPKNINIQARKEAGFSCHELNFIAKKSVC